MKVYCRFAPPRAFVSTTGVEREESDSLTSSWVAPTMVLLSLRKCGNNEQQTFTVTDPLSGSMASSTCQRVFIPRSMNASALGTASLNSSAGQEEYQQEQQKEVFDEVVRPFLHDLISGRRCMFLAYGQTATGKTYTMFGPGVDDNVSELQQRNQIAPNKRIGLSMREEISKEEEEGMVPRFLRAIFDESCIEEYGKSVAFVDLSCLEVYNECTTDLVALQLQQQQQQQRKMSTNKKRNGKPSAVYDDVEVDSVRQAWKRYENSGLCSSGMMKISYKLTEKSQVLRSAMRLRCTSALECWQLLCGVLALRHRSQTERNVRSSRSHLLLRLVLHSMDVSTESVDQLGEAMFVDLAGSETYREYAWIGTVMSPFLLTSTVDVPLVASTFTATRRDGDGLTAAQRNSLRIKEMRHINSSLLALRKVVRALRTTSLTTRVPFRDSTLTTILEPFLVPGESATVAWIVCCSSRQRDFHETVESLRLGAEASAIPAHVQLIPTVFPTSMVSRNTLSSNNNNHHHHHHHHISGGNGTSSVGVSGERILSSEGVYTQLVVSSSSSSAVASNTGDKERSNEKRKGDTISGAVIKRGGRNSNNSSAINSSKNILATDNNYPNSYSDADKNNDRENKNEEDVEVYKQYAWQLLEQCKTLCERYDECVEELARAKQVIIARDREIAELRKVLATTDTKKGDQQQGEEEQQQQQQKKSKNKKEEEIKDGAQKVEKSIVSTAPTFLSSSHCLNPDAHTSTAPPAWLRKSAVHLNCNDIPLALRHLSVITEPKNERKAKKQQEEVHPLSLADSVHRTAEIGEAHDNSNNYNGADKNNIGNDDCDKDAIDFIDSILHRYCVHHDPLQDMNDTSSRNNMKNNTMTDLARTPVGVLESKRSNDTSLFTTPAEALLGTKTSVSTDAVDRLKLVNARRERLVSFVSPSSHGAVPLLKLEEELRLPHVIPPPPMRSSLCTNVLPSLGEVLQDQRQKWKQTPKEEVTKTKETDASGKGMTVVADENVAAGILQHLISRSAAFVGNVPQ
ncbi:Kinesin motor domain [Trypanosoma melophagium]|uniref:Kinesin motor domain n=1 Tax=Trypanosoma melophagium TaxID=715481 RepID=UPI00351A3008|nr:Kinesin motor domain [Trypanosoma melophagium]